MGGALSCDRSQHQDRQQHARGQPAPLGEAIGVRLPAGHAPVSGCSSRSRSRGPAEPIQVRPDTTDTPQAPRRRHQPTTDLPPAYESPHASARRHHECDVPEHLVRAAIAQRAAPSAAYAASSLRVNTKNIVPHRTTPRSRIPLPTTPSRSIRPRRGPISISVIQTVSSR
jgi:hypothetical protein